MYAIRSYYAPEAVEREVTKKIEEEVNSVEGVKRVFSYSNEGFSVGAYRLDSPAGPTLVFTGAMLGDAVASGA